MNKEYLDKYTTTYGVRYSKKQKRKAREAIAEDFQELGMKSVIVEGSNFLSKSKSLVVGSIKTAQRAIVVPLDTPQRVLWPKSKYFPLSGNENLKQTLISKFGPIVILYVMLLGMFQLFGILAADNATLSLVFTVVTVLLLGLVLYLLFVGFSNKHNANRNSATIASALTLASELDTTSRKKLLFIFVDKTDAKNLGAKSVAKELNDKGRNMEYICLDCIGVGSQVQVGYTSESKKTAHDLLKTVGDKSVLRKHLDVSSRTQTMMEWFSRSVAITCGELKTQKKQQSEEVYVEGTATGKDRHVEEENLDKVVQILKDFLKK